MSIFNRLGKKISDTGMDVARQAKDFTEINRLNAAISTEEKRIQELYALLGKTYFSFYKGKYGEEFSEIVEAINGSQGKIATYRNLIQEKTRKLICENCGAELPEGSCFCSNCGKPVSQVRAIRAASSDMICKKCGKALIPGDLFCTHCGAKIERLEITAGGEG